MLDIWTVDCSLQSTFILKMLILTTTLWNRQGGHWRNWDPGRLSSIMWCLILPVLDVLSVLPVFWLRKAELSDFCWLLLVAVCWLLFINTLMKVQNSRQSRPISYYIKDLYFTFPEPNRTFSSLALDKNFYFRKRNFLKCTFKNMIPPLWQKMKRI